MDGRLVDKYIRVVDRDVRYIDEAIGKGARLSLEEWHDFVFKSEVAGFASSHISEYAVVYSKECEMAKISAAITAYILTVQLGGFTDSKAQKAIKGIVKQYNKMMRPVDRVKFMCTDSDGVISYVLEAFDMSTSVRRPINSRDSLCYFLQEVWCFMVQEIHVFNKETCEFLRSHMLNEINNIMLGLKPVPYIGFMKANTLESVLYGKTNYETARPSATKDSTGERIKVLKPTGTGDSKPRNVKK